MKNPSPQIRILELSLENLSQLGKYEIFCLISGTESYKSTLDAKASASGAFWGASFSASTDFKSIETTTKNASTFYTQSEASCCAYSASILEYNPPAFSQNFLSGIDGLPKVSSSKSGKKCCVPFFSKISSLIAWISAQQ